jgi:UDP-N-acetylglucosamine 2-epimerase (non-hydrolysing)
LLLYGDLAATGAALPAADSAGVPVVHVEAGYRSGDATDPEETTRILASRTAAAHLAYSDTMVANLLDEGVPGESVYRVPDPARLSLLRHASRPRAKQTPAAQGLVTFHHDETFETPGRLAWLVEQLRRLARSRPLHAILYRRTARELRAARLLDALTAAPGIVVSPTLPYRAYIGALEAADFVVTDSSGVQDDCVTLGRPCVVTRRASPRPVVAPLRLLAGIESGKADLAGAVRATLAQPPSASPAPGDPGRFAAGLRAAISRAAGTSGKMRRVALSGA